MHNLLAIVLTAFQVGWALIWAKKHSDLRKARTYALGRMLAASDKWYKPLSTVLYVAQNVLTISCLWSDSPLLLRFQNNDGLRLLGAALIAIATWLYFLALRHLGRHYSPCYDSHVPFEMVSSGPYRVVRHPMYIAKIALGIGTLLMCGSLWLLPPCVYLIAVTVRAIAKENAYLSKHVPGCEMRTSPR